MQTSLYAEFFALVNQQVSNIRWYMGDDDVACRHPEKNAVPNSVCEPVKCWQGYINKLEEI